MCVRRVVKGARRWASGRGEVHSGVDESRVAEVAEEEVEEEEEAEGGRVASSVR